jgi:hypothetical protein
LNNRTIEATGPFTALTSRNTLKLRSHSCPLKFIEIIVFRCYD